MASLTLASPCMISSTIFNCETSSSNNRRDDYSFSSYLNLIRESLAKDQTDSGDTSPTSMRISIGKTQGEDGELDVFGADKYFSGVMDGDSTNYMEKTSPVSSSSCKKDQGKMMMMMMSLKSISMTESTCSETTSANSRNTLLRDQYQRKLSSSSSSSGRRSRRLLRVFRCSCSGKDATRVDEDMNIVNGNRKEEPHFVERSSFATKIEDGLTFMTSNSQMGSAARVMTIQKDTFGCSPPFIEKGDVMAVSTMRKSLTLLTPPLATRHHDDDDEDDLLSETSSDLFEIDSLSINGNGNPLFRPETGYEPSEASIDWSVTTASAGNEEQICRLDGGGGKRPSKSSSNSNSNSNSKHSMLLGCASEKAVNVTKENYNKKMERLSSASNNNCDQQMRFESLPPLLRYHASQALHSRHSLDFTYGGGLSSNN